jgi:hypothetical protein
MKHRAQTAVGVLSHKTDLEEGLDALADSILEFRRLRKVSKAASKGSTRTPVQKRKKLPSVYSLRARHSASFHEVFVRSWSCLEVDSKHDRHTASLLLDVDEKSEGVDLRLILEYESHSGVLRQK